MRTREVLSPDQIKLAGPEASFVYFSVGMVASALTVRLVTLLDVLIKRATHTEQVRDWAKWRREVIADCLSRVHIVTCTGAVQVSSSSSVSLQLAAHDFFCDVLCLRAD